MDRADSPPVGMPATGADPIELARAGDLRAFEALYREHVGRVLAICRRMTADPDLAEELTQETFIRAWTKLGTFRPGGRFGPWIGKVAVNVVLSNRRTRVRRAFREEARDDLSHLGDDAPASSAGVGVDLERAIAQLPPGARAAFVLHDVEGYRHEEIARMLGVVPGTSKAQVHRARKLLRKVLGR